MLSSYKIATQFYAARLRRLKNENSYTIKLDGQLGVAEWSLQAHPRVIRIHLFYRE